MENEVIHLHEDSFKERGKKRMRLKRMTDMENPNELTETYSLVEWMIKERIDCSVDSQERLTWKD